MADGVEDARRAFRQPGAQQRTEFADAGRRDDAQLDACPVPNRENVVVAGSGQADPTKAGIGDGAHLDHPLGRTENTYHGVAQRGRLPVGAHQFGLGDPLMQFGVRQCGTSGGSVVDVENTLDVEHHGPGLGTEALSEATQHRDIQHQCVTVGGRPHGHRPPSVPSNWVSAV